MSNNVIKTEIKNGITGVFVNNSNFKTRRITISFVTPLTCENSASCSMLAKLLVSSNKKYPNYASLVNAMNNLYGAKLSGNVIRTGDNQILSISIETIRDCYALDGSDISSQASNFLLDMIFNPNVVDGAFVKEDFEREKRLLLEDIDSVINQKRRYAIGKTLEYMCSDEPFGVPAFGGKEAASKLEPASLYLFYNKILAESRVIITITGDKEPSDIYNLISNKFEGNNSRSFEVKVEPSKYSNNSNEYSENMNITQGKLVMGFKTEKSSSIESAVALQMFTDIFGGAPYSLLFTVVREKMSLCYYCASVYYSLKGILCVDSGVEFDKFDATKEGILSQLSRIQNGDFDDEIINSSKMGISDSLRGIYDSAAGLESWYLYRTFDKFVMSPDEYINEINKLTKEDVIKCSKNVKLDTVFLLKGVE